MNTSHNTLNDDQTITPYFTVEDANLLINFMISSFDAFLVKENRYDDGRVQHARLRIGNSLIMLNQSSDEYPTNVSQMHIYVNNADEAYAMAIKHGGVSLMKPNDRPHGDRMAGIKDPCGNVWWLASRQI